MNSIEMNSNNKQIVIKVTLLESVEDATFTITLLKGGSIQIVDPNDQYVFFPEN